MFLFQANKTLLEENEDLNAQLLARAIHEGQHMLAEGSSLADELDHLTKEEVTLIYEVPITITSNRKDLSVFEYKNVLSVDVS